MSHITLLSRDTKKIYPRSKTSSLANPSFMRQVVNSLTVLNSFDWYDFNCNLFRCTMVNLQRIYLYSIEHEYLFRTDVYYIIIASISLFGMCAILYTLFQLQRMNFIPRNSKSNIMKRRRQDLVK